MPYLISSGRVSNVASQTVTPASVPTRKPLRGGGLGAVKKMTALAIIGGTNNLKPTMFWRRQRVEMEVASPAAATLLSSTWHGTARRRKAVSVSSAPISHIGRQCHRRNTPPPLEQREGVPSGTDELHKSRWARQDKCRLESSIQEGETRGHGAPQQLSYSAVDREAATLLCVGSLNPSGLKASLIDATSICHSGFGVKGLGFK